MNTALNKTGVVLLTNKSGGSVAKGDLVIIDTANASSFITTTTAGFTDGLIGVVLEPNGIADDATGAVAFGVWCPKINLESAAAIGEFIKHHSVAKQGTPHAAPMVAGDFAIALETGTTPAGILFGSIFQGAGGIQWDQVIDENGASFANFTSGGGTWSSDGTVIKQTDTGASVRRAQHNDLIALGLPCILEAEVQIRTAGGYGGIIVGFDGSGAGGMLLRVSESGNLLEWITDNTTSRLTKSITINTNTWYKLKMICHSGFVTGYIDDVLKGTGGLMPNSNDASYIGLWSFGAEVWWRNIKLWTQTLP